MMYRSCDVTALRAVTGCVKGETETHHVADLFSSLISSPICLTQSNATPLKYLLNGTLLRGERWYYVLLARNRSKSVSRLRYLPVSTLWHVTLVVIWYFSTISGLYSLFLSLSSSLLLPFHHPLPNTPTPTLSSSTSSACLILYLHHCCFDTYIY